MQLVFVSIRASRINRDGMKSIYEFSQLATLISMAGDKFRIDFSLTKCQRIENLLIFLYITRYDSYDLMQLNRINFFHFNILN